MIALLLRARYVVRPLVAVLLVLLVLFGKRVSYEQSIGSFFADDDPDMAVYQKAATTFGDDNFVFLVYDDPELLTPAGHGPRRPSWRRRSGRDRSPACCGSSRSTRCRCSGRSTTPCSRSTGCPPSLRKLALDAAKRTVKNVDLKTNAMTVSGAVRAADADGARGAQGAADAAPPVPRDADRRDGRRRRPSSSG